MDGAKDASQMLEEQGAEALLKSCVNSVTGFSYLVSSALKRYDIRQPKGKSSVFKEVKPYLDATSSEIERQGYIKYLADVLRIPEGKVTSDYMRQQEMEPEEIQQDQVKKKQYNPLKVSTELNAMLLLMKNRDLFDRFRNKIRVSDLTDTPARELYTVLEDASRQDIKTNEVILQMIADEQLKDLVVSALVDPMYNRENADNTLRDAVYQIKLRHLEEQRNRVTRLLSNGEMENMDAEEVKRLLSTKAELDQDIVDLKREMDGKEGQ